jgi:unsaturated rhamnogalacturonyl hydrolase
MNSKSNFWTEKNSPVTIGRLVITDLLSREDFMYYEVDEIKSVHYAEACAGFGALRFAGLLKDRKLIDDLASRYRRVIDEDIPNTKNHVDANVYGILPLEAYIQTGIREFLVQGMELADLQWKNPLPNGMTSQARYWIDDIWMIASLQIGAYKATNDRVYLERASLEIDMYIKKLQEPEGLFFHGNDASFFWGRGNGWVAAGLAELLTFLPSTDINYDAIKNGYVKMMNALKGFQTVNGMWRQLIDKQSAWDETSATAMFGYSMTVGVKMGILDEKEYLPVIERSWIALCELVNDDGKLKGICSGTGQSSDINYYLNRPVVTGDLHGQAPMLWFAFALLNDYGIH